MPKLIFGCGYLGLRVAALWREAGEKVHVVTRSQERAAKLSAAGYFPLVADITQPQTLATISLPDTLSTLLFAVGFDRRSGTSIQEVYAGGLKNVLSLLDQRPSSAPDRFIYISSTGVYGSPEGGGTGGADWVDEQTPCHPLREGGQACLAAEELLQKHPLGHRAVVLRLAGIYGPGRIPRAKDLQAGTPIDAPAEGYLNLIHVADAARIVLLAETRAAPPATYVVADGSPVLRAEYYRELARLLNAPSPTFIPPAPDSPAARRAASDKRISPARLFRDLQPQLAFPSYREGLSAIVAEQT